VSLIHNGMHLSGQLILLFWQLKILVLAAKLLIRQLILLFGQLIFGQLKIFILAA